MEYESYDQAQRGDSDVRSTVLRRLRDMTPPKPKPVLFDVGAGTGQFLHEAQDAGFEVRGNDYSAQALAYAKQKYGIMLSGASLRDQSAGSFDIVTMWCVLAHVNDTFDFLSDAYRMLNEGGTLFLRTPRTCGIDRLGRGLELSTFGVLSQVSDRRVNLGHRHQYNETSLTAQLKRVGFQSVEVEKRGHYTFDTATYAAGTGGPLRPLVTAAAPLLDILIDKNWFFRNSLFAYARRF